MSFFSYPCYSILMKKDVVKRQVEETGRTMRLFGKRERKPLNLLTTTNPSHSLPLTSPGLVRRPHRAPCNTALAPATALKDRHVHPIRLRAPHQLARAPLPLPHCLRLRDPSRSHIQRSIMTSFHICKGMRQNELYGGVVARTRERVGRTRRLTFGRVVPFLLSSRALVSPGMLRRVS